MRRLAASLSVLLLLPLVAPAAEFDWLVREFSRQTGVKQTHIPFFGLARFAVAVAHPAGTSELRLAVFEHPNMEFGEFSRTINEVVGSSWKPIVRVRSRNGESTKIFTQSEGSRLRLLITSMDKNDATFVQVKIKPEELLKFIDEHRHAD